MDDADDSKDSPFSEDEVDRNDANRISFVVTTDTEIKKPSSKDQACADLSKLLPPKNAFRRHSFTPLLHVSDQLSKRLKVGKTNVRRSSCIHEITVPEQRVTNLEPSQEEIAKEAELLCYRYLYATLKEWKNIPKQASLSRLRGLTMTETSDSVKDVSSELNRIGSILEKAHPVLYISALRNLQPTPPPHLITLKQIRHVFKTIATYIIQSEDERTNVTWGRIIATFSLVGALSRDCYRIGRPDYVIGVVETFRNFVSEELAEWISDKGGWLAMTYHFRQNTKSQKHIFVIGFLIVVAATILTLSTSLIGR
ncbi:Uncharacterised protein g5899 [Pycnogonum litorale]